MRGARQISLLALVVVGSLLVGTASRAAVSGTVDAQTLATGTQYCENPPLGSFNVAPGGTLKVVGGPGNVSGDCTIQLLDGSKIKFEGTTFSGSGTLTITGGNKSQVSFKDSSVVFQGDVFIEPGCCNAVLAKNKVKISNSSVQSAQGSLRIHATSLGTGGKVSVSKDSTLYAGGTSGDSIQVLASNETGATKGSVKVSSSQLIALDGDILVSTLVGKTTVKDTILNSGSPPTVTAQGGKCSWDAGLCS